jgi:hypothetical protein
MRKEADPTAAHILFELKEESMSKKKSQKQPAPNIAPRRKKSVVIIVGLVLCLSMAGGIFAQWSTARMTILPAALLPQAQPTPTPSVLSKEYIYAGGKLVATEEPTAAPLPSGTPTPCTPASSYPMLISEFRFRGATGTNDEFVELYNNSDAPVTVCAADSSYGWAVAASDGRTIFRLFNGTTIPARGHYLGANTSYSLTSSAAPDVTYSSEIADNTGIALFKSTTSFSAANALDAVGFSGTVSPFVEGNSLPVINTSNDECSFIRKFTNSLPQDTGDNSADFLLVSTKGCVGTVSGTTCTGTTAVLGAPGPENLASPIRRDDQIGSTYIEPLVASTAAPNRVRDSTAITDYPIGTISYRRKVTNNTSANITRLRFRVIDISTLNAPLCSNCTTQAQQADWRPISSPTISVTTTTNGTVTVHGTTLETPPTQSMGGGLNSTWSDGTVTLAQPLAPGASIYVQWLMGFKQGGYFRFYVSYEALP